MLSARPVLRTAARSAAVAARTLRVVSIWMNSRDVNPIVKSIAFNNFRKKSTIVHDCLNNIQQGLIAEQL